MGDLIQRDHLLRKQIEAEAVRQLKRLYLVTAGFTDPEPPTEEQRQLMEDGVLEL